MASSKHDAHGIQTSKFQYSIAAEDGKGRFWLNKATHSRLELGSGPEIELEVGDRPESASQLKLNLTNSTRDSSDSSRCVVRYESSDRAVLAEVTMEADPDWPILHKSVKVTNRGRSPIRLLNVVLGRFPVGTAKVEGGDRGFPLYLNGAFFVSITHPAGFAHVEGKNVVLRQYPGVKLPPGGEFQSMDAVYGVAKAGQARPLFVDYVKSRMCRVRYGQAKPYAILESFGGQPEGNFKTQFDVGVSESYLKRHLAEVETSERQNGVQFDFYGLEFWHDRAGDLTTFNRQNFPNGFSAVRNKILDLGMKPALWIDSGRLPQWTVDLNPATGPSRTTRDGVGSFCRASEPIASIYRNAYLYQMRTNQVGLVKFDNLAPNCVNPAHDHLPGPLYSTEAIYNSLIEFFSNLRNANRDIFIMLYWGYRSPWWLQYGDTYFECGEDIEAASPAQYPTPYARDAVTQRLDQAQLKITDTPWLGKDSLGVWLSDWQWNSSIGKARWQEGVIMDMARGSLLFQLWTDANWLTPPERAQAATFIKLLKANPECFERSRFFLGNPNSKGPYGYCCSNGKRTFLAINNACMEDRRVRLQLDRNLGLKDQGKKDAYRWYPNPARIAIDADDLSLALRPYEVALIEIVGAGSSPSLSRQFSDEAPSQGFEENSQALPMAVRVVPTAGETTCRWITRKPERAEAAKGAKLTIKSDGSVLASGPNNSNDKYSVSIDAKAGVTGILLETLTDDSLPFNGPGRAVNGNFALTKLRVFETPSRELTIRAAESDFSQTSFGGWPISAAIDEDPKTGWSIHPEVGQPHAAVFRFDHALNVASPLKVVIEQGENGHNLGRFRISTTTDAVPALPSAFRTGVASLEFVIPATKTGGLLVLEGGSADDGPEGWLGQNTLQLASVWASDSNWACPWTAWRGEIGPLPSPRKVIIRFRRLHTQAAMRFVAHFLPK